MPGPPGKEASAEPPSVNLSFANNFWGKDDAGVGPMLERMHNAKVTSDELKCFYAARAAIEDEYARKLLNLSRKPLGSSEAGTLKLSLNVIREQVESMGKAHQSIAQQMKTELEEPLAAFAGGLKERRKIVQNGIEKLLRTKMQQTAAVNKTRDRYEQDCLKIKGFLAQAHMVMGQEERKNKAKLEKTQIQLSTSSSEYEAAVKVLEETTGRWNRDWKAACDKFQDLEEERIDFTKSSLWTFANIASTVCVSDDAACEQIRLSLEDCDVEKDITTFIKDSGTGQEIPDPPKFINFCRGDADTASEASDEGNYSVAQFQRTMNPAYRGASPQPSVFESHHDPNNLLAKELGHEETNAMHLQEPVIPVPRQPAQPVPAAQPMQSAPQQSRGVQPDPRLIQAQQQAHQNYQQSQVPHNDYPMDGMTQFCRRGAPSDRSTNPSPMRPSSRDSQSDYSNPTSFSSIEPPSGSASPGKPMAPASPQPVEERLEPKKKGFFQNHSPFRRRSKHEIIPPTSAASNRNTWGASTNRRDESASPTKRYGGGILSNDGRSASPEPVDPRSNFQLNIGNNVFDVASPDAHTHDKASKQEQEELDPIAQALAELKGVTKQSSLRVSADRYAGLATPIPPGTPAVGAAPTGGVPTPLSNVTVNPAQREPPPSYDQPMSRLGAPKPAHTSRAMQQTTQRYIDQKVNMFNTGSATRPPTRGGQEAPRAASPAPPRAVSPRPGSYQSQPPPPTEYRAVSPSPRAASPNPYAAPTGAGRPAYAPSMAGGRPGQQSPSPYATTTSRAPLQSPGSYGTTAPGARPRASTATNPMKSAYGTPTGRGSYSSSRGASPSHAVPRAVSPQPPPQPQPAYASATRPTSRAAGAHSRAASPNPAFRQSYDRPSSSRGSDMALQLAPGPGSERGEGSVYGGSQRGRGNSTQSQQQRPMSSYYGGADAGYAGASGGMGGQLSTRVRSKSVAEPRQYTKDGRMILHYSRAMYMYTAQIPEELSFAKGDILAVLRLQDDGWWEAEVVGKNSRPGLVPSNYLQNC